MKDQLDNIKKAYDLTVEQYRKSINPFDDLPYDIKNSLFYKSLTTDKLSIKQPALPI
jgi:hypothetical protein